MNFLYAAFFMQQYTRFLNLVIGGLQQELEIKCSKSYIYCFAIYYIILRYRNNAE